MMQAARQAHSADFPVGSVDRVWRDPRTLSRARADAVAIRLCARLLAAPRTSRSLRRVDALRFIRWQCELKGRAALLDHNAGRCPHTVSRRPWQRHVVIEFSNERSAIRFERYLKSGSGRAFAKRHFEEW
jgi:putative endonuclease